MDLKSENPFLIELTQVSCGYRKKPLLTDVSLKIKFSDRVAIIGDNGQGKSTLLKTMMGLLKPIAGQIKTSHSKTELSYVPQNAVKEFLMPFLVKDFIDLGFPPKTSFSKPERQDIIKKALAQVGLDENENAELSILSGGQYQRAVLARALVRDPKLLYLDEPTSGLDRNSEERFMKELQGVSRSLGMSFIMVLHDFRLIQKYFSHVIWVHQSKVFFYELNEALSDHDFIEFTGLKA